jgi:3,4-dihydroxy 2-butanone 4-phosphate synthase/GTP cyclohydrolase II
VKALGASGVSGSTRGSAGVAATGAAAAAGSAPEPQQEVREVLRTYGVGAQILKDLGVRRMRVLSAPKQIHGISAFDLEIEGYVGEEG